MTRKDKAEIYPYIIYYCNLHNTTINSTLVDKNGKKIKIPKCNSRVYYEKNTESFYLETNHSLFCENRKKQNYQNLADINAEVSNYQQFRKDLIKYLEFNPVIKYTEFKIKANKLYYKNNCNFEIKDNTFKNIYYNWRKNSNVNTKYSVFKNSLTKNKKNFLRDYCYCLLYNHTGRKQIKHEHMIFCSDYFIKKLRASKHWYIDGTWVYPKGFKQLIIILYIDDKNGKRYPGVFSLINNKTQEGYYKLFNNIISIITIENTKNLNLETYTIDFESALINVLTKILKNCRAVGCYYHYVRNIYKEASKLKINKKSAHIDIIKKFIDTIR